MNVTSDLFALVRTCSDRLSTTMLDLVSSAQEMQAALAPGLFGPFGLHDGVLPVAAAGCIVLALPVAARFLYRKCVHPSSCPDGPEGVLAHVHFYAGRAHGADLVRYTAQCKGLLRTFPHYVNKPLAENSFMSHGYTPFLRACWNNNFDLIAFMMTIGADIRLTNSDGETALYLVAYRVSKSPHWDPRALNLLWDSGSCSVDDVNVHNNTMLHLAAKAGNDTLVRWLLLHGAEPNVMNNSGYTPRLLAIKKGSPRHMVVASLLSDGHQRVGIPLQRFVVRSDGILVTHRPEFQSGLGSGSFDDRVQSSQIVQDSDDYLPCTM